MMPAPTPRMTVEAFATWTSRPENSERRFELDQGEVIEVPLQGEVHGFVCWRVIMALSEYVTRRRSGHLLTNNCGLIVTRDPDTVRGPDVMLFLSDRSLDQAHWGYVERIPNLVVEVFSASDQPGKLNRRIDQYHRRGVPLVWVVYPEERMVNVCRPNEFPKVLDESDDLTGNGVLPDFSCRVLDLFTLPGQSPPAAG